MRLDQRFSLDPEALLARGEDQAFIHALRYDYGGDNMQAMRHFAEDAFKTILKLKHENAQLKLMRPVDCEE